MTAKLKFSVVVLAFLLLIVVPVYARMHFVGDTSIGSGSLTAHAKVAGVGGDGGDVLVTLSVASTGEPLVALCQNKGKNIAPGQNPINVNVTASQTVFVLQNGSSDVDFHVELLPTPEEAGCPNSNWTVIDLLGYLNVKLTAVNLNDGETAQLVFDCFVNEAKKTVQCTQVN